MQPSDIARIVSVTSPAVSPDGALVAYVVRKVDLDANCYRSAVWLAPTDGSADPWQVTSGEQEDGNPVWSPDGRRLAFTSRRGHNERAVDSTAGKTLHSLHVLPVRAGGETVALLTRDEGIDGLSWAPDGSQLAFISRVRDKRYSDGDDDQARPPRQVDRLFARLDNVGWTVDRPTHVFVVPSDGSAPARQISSGAHEYGEASWSPDSRRLVTTAARHPDADLGLVNDVWLFELEGAEPVQLTSTDAAYAFPSWSSDGATIAVLREPIDIGYYHDQVTLLDVESGKLTMPTTDLDRQCAPYPGARAPLWHDAELLFTLEDAGAVHLYRVHEDGRIDRVLGGERVVTGYDARAGVLAFTATTPTQPAELYVLHDGQERRLTHHQAAFLGANPARPPEHFPVTSEDGTVLDAWLIQPAGLAPGQRCPVLLNIHGGPHTQYGYFWHDEFQLYAGAGFAVLYANPHGSSGYSEGFGRSIISPKSPVDPGTGWGGIDHRDVLAVVDEALRRFPALDADRVGVMGGSYGGYLTSWIVGHDAQRRFAAACSERAVNNVLSLEWSSDAAGYFRFGWGVGHLDDPEELIRMSPITYVRDIDTPLLILHSENDLRCHIEQADCLWVSMRLLHKDVEYYRFPAESHELSRSGSPRHRVQRAELIIDWFRRRMPGKA
jgi:dipeptidyl aminopeptidase/acylaminoacyl peptidase